MSDMPFLFPEPRTEDEYRAAIDLLLTEMQRLNKQIQSDQAEIEHLQAETRLLQAQTEAIKARTQARLEALEAMERP